MSLKSAPFYWLECDHCGRRADYGDFSALDSEGDAIQAAFDSEWHESYDGFYCPDCIAWDDEGNPRPPAQASSSYPKDVNA